MKASNHLACAAICTAAVIACFGVPRSSAQLITPTPFVIAADDYGGENGNPGGATRGEPFAETFTATSDGMVTTVSAGFNTPFTPSDPYYIFQFRNVIAGGLPSSQVLATVDVPTAPILSSSSGIINLTADFSSFGIWLGAGQQYAFSIDVPGMPGTTTYNDFIWGETQTPYSGGGSYYISPTTGAHVWAPGEPFLFTIEAVPEPSLLALAAPICFWVLRTRRRIQKPAANPAS